MKAVKLLPVLALAFVLLAVPMIPVADASDDATVDFGTEAADVSFADDEEQPTNEWYGLCFLIIFIIALLIACYYGFVKRD